MSVTISSVESRFSLSYMSAKGAEALPWIGKGFLALLDQTLISGSNFIITILLARWLIPEAYGAYEFSLSIFFMLSLVHQAVILEPMAVFGPSKHRNAQRDYLGALLWLHATLALLILLVLGAFSMIARLLGASASLVGGLAGVSFSGPCVLLLWLVRCVFYMRLKPRGAALGALCYSVLILSMLFLINKWGTLTPFTAFLLMAIGAVVTSALLLIKLKPNLNLKAGLASLRGVWHDHWSYGRWAFAGSVAKWIPWNLHIILIGSIAGLAGVADLKALINLTLPAAQGFTALSLLTLPYASHACDRQGLSGMAGVAERKIKKYWNNIMNWLFKLNGKTCKPAASTANSRMSSIRAGDRVRVRSKEEIEGTLDHWRRLKGCTFMNEMWQYCGTTQRILKRMERFVDERDLTVKKSDGIVLVEGLMCQGTQEFGRCDRSCHYFWREEWMEKIDD